MVQPAGRKKLRRSTAEHGKSTAQFEQGNQQDGFELNLLEKVEKHLLIEVMDDQSFWDGQSTADFRLGKELTDALGDGC